MLAEAFTPSQLPPKLSLLLNSNLVLAAAASYSQNFTADQHHAAHSFPRRQVQLQLEVEGIWCSVSPLQRILHKVLCCTTWVILSAPDDPVVYMCALCLFCTRLMCCFARTCCL